MMKHTLQNGHSKKDVPSPKGPPVQVQAVLNALWFSYLCPDFTHLTELLRRRPASYLVLLLSMLRRLVLLLWTAGAAAAAASGATLNVYSNSALAGSPSASRTVDDLHALSFSLGAGAAGSAEALATLLAASDTQYSFACDFGEAHVGFLHVDGHLVCQAGAYSAAGDVTHLDTPLPARTKLQLPLRLSLYYGGSGGGDGNVSVSVVVNATTAGGAPRPAPRLLPGLPTAEVARASLNRALLQGWGLWHSNSVLDAVLLPEGAVVRAALCDATGDCLEEALTDWQNGTADTHAALRLGVHASDRSFAQLFAAHKGCNVSFSFAGGASAGAGLSLLAEPVVVGGGGGGADACAGFTLVLAGYSAWFRSNAITASAAAATLSFAALGLRSTTLAAVGQPAAADAAISPRLAAAPHLSFALAGGAPAGASTVAPAPTIDGLRAALGSARDAETAQLAKVFGGHAAVAGAVQAATMWNNVYVPTEAGPITPVVRGNPWHLNGAAVSTEWAYIIFDWDNIFAAYMLGLDARAKGYAYSTLTQVIKGKTADGFVSNYASGSNKQGWSQPPVGSKVLLELYHRYGDAWLVELLFDDLYDWSNWFAARRTREPLGLICLGGPYMQAGRWESGLDNSPMYDGDFFNETAEQMELYDVGMSSMHAMDAEALSELATAIGRDDAAAVLSARAAKMRQLIATELWDEESGTFVNKFSGNGSFYRRVSPTSFYPLLAAAATDEQAATMATRWLFNTTRFCLSPNGDMAGNSEDCYWGLPSISADDDAFPDLGYWRGYVWGPMAQLTYWGLQRYKHVPEIAAAATSLTRQAGAMMMAQWNANAHICENYLPSKGAAECSPGAMHFYHWGALNGMVGLLEAGFWES